MSVLSQGETGTLLLPETFEGSFRALGGSASVEILKNVTDPLNRSRTREVRRESRPGYVSGLVHWLPQQQRMYGEASVIADRAAVMRL
jgi:hypothetical protein